MGPGSPGSKRETGLRQERRRAPWGHRDRTLCVGVMGGGGASSCGQEEEVNAGSRGRVLPGWSRQACGSE